MRWIAIAGAKDAALSALQNLKLLRPDVRLVVIDGATHAAGNPTAAPRQPMFVTAIREFIAAH